MELRQLSYFTAIVENGTITAAAKRLHMSQPPLSQQLAQLEDELGCRLFERDTRHLRLTEAGRVLYERSGEILKLCAAAKSEVTDVRGGGAGTLHAGVVSSLSSSLLPQWAAAFRTQYPQVRLEFIEADSYRLLEQVRAQQIDLALVRRPFSAQDLEVTALRCEPLYAVGPAALLDALPAGALPVAALAGCPLIIYQRWERILHEAFEEAAVQPEVVCRCGDARTAISLAGAGIGVAIAPQSVLPAARAGMAARMLCGESLRSEICVVSLRDRYIPAAARHFIEVVTEGAF